MRKNSFNTFSCFAKNCWLSVIVELILEHWGSKTDDYSQIILIAGNHSNKLGLPEANNYGNVLEHLLNTPCNGYWLD